MPREKTGGPADEWGRIAARINAALPAMLPTNKKIALGVLEDAQLVGFSSIQSLGRAFGVSEASIIRFAKDLGFSGFADLKKTIQKAIKQQLNPYGEISSAELTGLDDRQQLERVMRLESENLRKTFRNLDPRALGAIIDGLAQAERVYICGFGSTRHIIGLYGFLLTSNAAKQVVTLSGSIADYIQKLSLFTERDALLVATIPIYAREDIQIARLARKRGGKVYLFTDSARCPVYPLADQTVLCGNTSLQYTNSYVGLIAAFKVLMDMWLLRDGGGLTGRMKVVTGLEMDCYRELGELDGYFSDKR
jgi:DNA-binding MurR/RpiR family transcriptional regulator